MLKCRRQFASTVTGDLKPPTDRDQNGYVSATHCDRRRRCGAHLGLRRASAQPRQRMPVCRALASGCLFSLQNSYAAASRPHRTTLSDILGHRRRRRSAADETAAPQQRRRRSCCCRRRRRRRRSSRSIGRRSRRRRRRGGGRDGEDEATLLHHGKGEFDDVLIARAHRRGTS